MSFHHAPLGKGSASGDVDPLNNPSKQADSGIHQPTSDESSTQKQIELSEAYDEETRFELLSAYLDDEVTPQERKLVAQWLRDDPQTLQMYRRLLMLRQAIRTAPIQAQPPLEVPTPPKPSWEIFSQSTLRRTLVFAIAIALFSGLSHLGTTSGRQQLQEAWQFIKTLPQSTLLELASTTGELTIDSLDNPYISKIF
ncbi:anti-sigma factor family protein [Leptothoe spongobia]|uniref:Transcriptional regulator n=1 Tax=Leptothoe spongobia TAU-MAC 1115 TaxID=1967444 RepID=A0A947DGS3_9CYAN|nr:hypothetical protein [Leptothoe spongobia]MBT9316576.1 hypothetical protein [Leptothoe spongobia TAU-MAC 1115]